MARVLIPHMARRYNANPKGSATTQVTMSSDNPFERRTHVMNSTRSMLPGMGALGVDDAATVTPPSGIDWTKILGGAEAAATQLAAAKLAQLTTPKLPKATGMTYLPVSGPSGPPVSKPSILPWAIGGGVLVLAVGAFFLLRK